MKRIILFSLFVLGAWTRSNAFSINHAIIKMGDSLIIYQYKSEPGTNSTWIDRRVIKDPTKEQLRNLFINDKQITDEQDLHELTSFKPFIYIFPERTNLVTAKSFESLSKYNDSLVKANIENAFALVVEFLAIILLLIFYFYERSKRKRLQKAE